MNYEFRLMRTEDIPDVLEIEKRSNYHPWTEKDFLREINENGYAQYVVGVDLDQNRVFGYGGMWILFDESHITNVAIHPDYRGKHLANELMAAMMAVSIYYGAEKMTLEVRVSNERAIQLYLKWGFVFQGKRKAYYEDNREDAHIMWNENIKEWIEGLKEDGKTFDSFGSGILL